MRRIPKQYGSYKPNICVICSSQASIKNSQGLPSCQKHKKEVLENLKILMKPIVFYLMQKKESYTILNIKQHLVQAKIKMQLSNRNQRQIILQTIQM